jgi:hypothetical protein
MQESLEVERDSKLKNVNNGEEQIGREERERERERASEREGEEKGLKYVFDFLTLGTTRSGR